MDNTIFFERFGLNANNFVNKHYESVTIKNGKIYEAEEQYRLRMCPNCCKTFMYVHSKRWVSIKLSTTIGLTEILRVKRIRYICPICKKTHTFELEGVPRNKVITNQITKSIQLEFYNIQSFSDIAARYGVSVQSVINIFDEATSFAPRRELPEFLCIDEKGFEGDTFGKYCVVLSDFFSNNVIDVLPDRQMPFLEQYFSNISVEERRKVKVVTSDMYEGYSSIRDKYFPNALFVIDLFHVVKLLTNAVNKIRIRTYNQIAIEDTIERHFMKNKWKVFLTDQFKITKDYYHSIKYDIYIPYNQIIQNCIKMNDAFWDGYMILQELIHYKKYNTFQESLKFIDRIIARLNTSGDELLEKVATTYSKWRIGIANGLAKNQTGRRFSNSIAENNNSHIQKVINVAYGYRNFKRFRARVMLILSYKRIKVGSHW